MYKAIESKCVEKNFLLINLTLTFVKIHQWKYWHSTKKKKICADTCISFLSDPLGINKKKNVHVLANEGIFTTFPKLICHTLRPSQIDYKSSKNYCLRWKNLNELSKNFFIYLCDDCKNFYKVKFCNHEECKVWNYLY